MVGDTGVLCRGLHPGVWTCGLFCRGGFRQHCLCLRPPSSQMLRYEPRMGFFSLNLTAGELPAQMGAFEKQEGVCVCVAVF